jgi:hypothetical protein
MSEELLLNLFPIGVGVLLFSIALMIYVRTRLFIRTAQQAKGTVIEMVYRRKSTRSGGKGGGYLPVYQFRTLDGKKITAKDSLSSNPPRFQVGQEVDVLYNPHNPHDARINQWMNLYFVPVLLGGLGLLFGSIGVIIVISKLGF